MTSFNAVKQMYAMILAMALFVELGLLEVSSVL
jgi:hypothetical protein